MKNFVDTAIIHVASGKGGDGAASFRREKYVPLGGPNGSDGGKGGDLYLVGKRNKRTLQDFQYQSKYKAEDGKKAIRDKTGASGQDVVIEVPLGTTVYDEDTGQVIADITEEDKPERICKGGRGGLGNLHFTNSVRQSPTFAQKGAPAEERTIRLELRTIADVGLVGLPNAGKSTLLSVISEARPKIGAYPFTTLSPNLGIVSIGYDSFSVADLPGLIEGAHEGHGLGDQFLRHAERTKVLVHVVDAFPLDESVPLENFKLIESEIASYDPDLAERPRIVALNKIDIAHEPEMIEEVAKTFSELPYPVFTISGATRAGVDELLKEMLELVKKVEMQEADQIPVLKPVQEVKEQPTWHAEKSDDGYVLSGERITRLFSMTNLENDEALIYLRRRLERMGVIERLQELGIEDGDTVIVGDIEFEYHPY